MESEDLLLHVLRSLLLRDLSLPLLAPQLSTELGADHGGRDVCRQEQ